MDDNVALYLRQECPQNSDTWCRRAKKLDERGNRLLPIVFLLLAQTSCPTDIREHGGFTLIFLFSCQSSSIPTYEWLSDWPFGGFTWPPHQIKFYKQVPRDLGMLPHVAGYVYPLHSLLSSIEFLLNSLKKSVWLIMLTPQVCETRLWLKKGTKTRNTESVKYTKTRLEPHCWWILLIAKVASKIFNIDQNHDFLCWLVIL